MAAEKPSIRQVKNDVVEIALPYLEGALITYLTAEVAVSGTSLTLKDNFALAESDYLILENIGTEKAEIIRITAAVTYGTAITVSACTFSHGVGTKVTKIRYNQVAIYGSTTATDTSPTIIGSATGIDVKRGANQIKATTTYAYYYARYYNVASTTYSSYSDSVAASGLSHYARGEIKKEFLSIYGERIDDLVTDDWLNRAINRWQQMLQERRRNWSFLRSSTTATTVQDQQKYSLPTDIQNNDSADSIISMKYSNEGELDYIDQFTFLDVTADHIGTTLAADVALVDVTISLTNSKDFASSGTINIQGDAIAYTGNTKATNTLTGVTGITATHTSGDEVWQTYDYGTPTTYTIDNGYFKLCWIPGSAQANKNIYIDYWARFIDLDDDSDLTACTRPGNCYKYLHWQMTVRRRLTDEVQLARQRIWEEDLEKMVSEDPDFRDVRISPTNYYSNPY